MEWLVLQVYEMDGIEVEPASLTLEMDVVVWQGECKDIIAAIEWPLEEAQMAGSFRTGWLA